ncbi:protoporphyrinogen oxidase [Brachybacterium endophyticum]|uniref:Protoporphyrinogen oxidase n=1 Tax=Brachybacterium endophyticum TaxID=2182385 RepID=A0A2U2RKV9_9MICO|nr:FAD-dependent oxidoreductase [Brachybacterium endophyticum]PWH06414.1 protoporphyrinogen oxidase [Brachybacterium endophyticum]
MNTDVLVLGGGIAGLLAARRHARAGARVTLLEQTQDVGGAVHALDLGGVTVDAGAEAYGTASGAVDALIGELGLGQMAVAPRSGPGSHLVSAAGSVASPRGGLLGIPGDPLALDARQALGTWGALRAWAERFAPASFGLTEQVSVADYVRTRMGARVADRLVAPIVGGVHSADPRSLELASVLPSLEQTVRETGSLAAAVRALRPASAGRSAGTAVRSLTATMAALPHALADDLRAHGGRILTGTRVTGLRRRGDSWEARLDAATTTAPDAATSDTGEPLHAAHLVLATDPDTARGLLSGGRQPAEEQPADDPAAAVARAIPETPAVPVRLVLLALTDAALDSFPTGTGALVAPGTPGIRAKGLTHSSAKWEHVQQAAVEQLGPHSHVLRLSYGRPGEVLPGDDGLDEEGITDLALADASAIVGIPLSRSQLRASHTVTWRRTMRQARPGHRAALDHLETTLGSTGLPLELTGAWRAGTGLDALVRHDGRTS